MANRPYFMSHDSEIPLVAGEAEDSIIVAANYQIPVLWLTLFRLTDLLNVDMHLEDAEGNESIGPVPTLHTSLGSAKAVYQERRGRIRSLLPRALYPHIDEWEALLASLTDRFVQVDLAEIWMMFTPAEFDAAIRDYLAGADDTSPQGWQDLLAQASLDDPEVARYGLRGYQWGRPLPWND